jgi:hypothetical protein
MRVVVRIVFTEATGTDDVEILATVCTPPLISSPSKK